MAALIVGLALMAGGALAAAEPGRLSTAESLVGEATYYGRGLMEEVAARRIGWGQVAPCEECEGGVALLECRHLGRRVWLVRTPDARHPEGEVVGPYLVVDCAAQADARALRARGWVVDLPWELGRRWRMRGPLPKVRVLFRAPAPEPGRPHCSPWASGHREPSVTAGDAITGGDGASGGGE